MKGMKKLFALVAVLALALTLTPVVTANAQVTPIPVYTMTVQDPVWTTEKALGVDLNDDGVKSEDLVLKIQGSIGGVDTLNTASFNFDAAAGLYVAVSNNNFTVYVFYNEISVVEDGVSTLTYEIAPGNVLSAEIPLQLFKVEPKDAVPTEVTSGEKVTITGTIAPLEDTLGLQASDYKVFVWKGSTLVKSAAISTTGTFSLTFNAYGNVGTKYNITVQNSTATTFNEVPYYTISVKNLADVTVNLIPETIVSGVENDVTLQLLVGDVKLGNHNVTGTITLGSETATFAGPTNEDGKITATGVKFNSVGVADVTVKVNGPDFYYGTGAAKLNVSTSEEYGLAVKWPTWKIGEWNTIEFSTPYAGYTIDSIELVKVSGPVADDTQTVGSTIKVIPLGYGELTLQVKAILKKGDDTTAISKTFSTTIPGYVATVDPEELVRGATQTLTVVVEDKYGNPVNNALVQFLSPMNSDDPIAKLDGKVTTSVNNGTYKLSIPGHKITKADAESYVEVISDDGLQAKVFVEIARSTGINITLDKTEIVLGPKTTLTVTVASPEALGGASLKLVDADGENTGVLAYTFTGAATVQKVTLPVNTMPEEAGVYQVVVESANYQGSATLTFVEPVFTATPAELLANSSNVVTFTSTNVEDLRAVTSVTATGAVKSITAKIAEEAITATIVTSAEKGTVKVFFKFNSGYEHEVELSSVYGKLTVENATIAFGTKVLAFTPVNAAGATLAAGTEVKINLLGNEYSGYVAADGSVKILIPELPMGTYSVLVKVAGYQDATFSLVVAEAEPEYKTVIELAPGMDIYTVNGETKFWDATPYIKEGRTLVPIRHLAEAVGFKADWDFSDPANKMVFIFKADQDPEKDKEHPFILLIIGQPTAMVNGNLVALDVAPEILNGRTMVPLRFVVETLGYQVEWLGNTIRLMK